MNLPVSSASSYSAPDPEELDSSRMGSAYEKGTIDDLVMLLRCVSSSSGFGVSPICYSSAG